MTEEAASQRSLSGPEPIPGPTPAPSRPRTLWPSLALVALCLSPLLFAPQWQALWAIWQGDGLRSIGALMLPASLLLCWRAWRRAPAAAPVNGTLWGLAPVAAALLAVHWIVLPPGLLFWLYAGGAVLLFLGSAGWRQAAFPLALLLFVNPVPWFINPLIDLRLQFLDARVAQAFAHLLGLPVQRQTVALSFSGTVGMFIGASCNGLRSAVAMGYLSLMVGHLRGLRWRSHALLAVAAVLLAYLVNLLRLCCLVLYNELSLHWTSLQNQEQHADRVIGGFLFLLAAWFLFAGPGFHCVRSAGARLRGGLPS